MKNIPIRKTNIVYMATGCNFTKVCYMVYKLEIKRFVGFDKGNN